MNIMLASESTELYKVNEHLNEMVDFLNAVYGLPAIGLVCLACLAFGYILRRTPKFPNSAIPLSVIVMGAAFLPLLSDWRASPLPLRIWIVRNFLVGALVGAGTWILHLTVISKLEERFPWLGNLLSGPDKNKNENETKPAGGG